MGASAKTTVLGICAILGALISAATGVVNGTAVDWTSIISAVMAGVGLLFAKDFNVSGTGK